MERRNRHTIGVCEYILEFLQCIPRNRPLCSGLFVQAGLFSAVVTALDIEAYKLLQTDPAQASVQLLEQISQQIAQLPMNLQGGNTTSTSTSLITNALNGRPTAQ